MATESPYDAPGMFHVGGVDSDKPDTITRCRQCLKIVGARWHAGPGRRGWKTYQHADARGEPYCPGGGSIQG